VFHKGGGFMITEYKGFFLKDRDDFRIQEISENVTIFLFDPCVFRVDKEDFCKLEANLAYETNATFSLIADEAMKGIIILILNPTVEHRYNNEDIKDAIIKYLFDHHIVNYN
jgi:hypothetical protein